MKNVISAAIIILSIASCAISTPVEWQITDGGNGHFYDVINLGYDINWGQAKTDAELHGGYLASITSNDENIFISALIQDEQYWHDIYFGPWIGGFQLPNSVEPSGGWTWVSGEPFEYANWAQTEPSNSSIGEDAIHFCNHVGLDGTNAKTVWNDLPSYNHYTFPTSYVIEYIPEPATLLLLGAGALVLRKRT